MKFLKSILGSFHSRALYQSVRSESGYRVGFTMMVALIGALVMSIVTVMHIHTLLLAVPEGKNESPLANALHQIADQLPVMTFSAGKLVTREPGATTINLTWNNEGAPLALATIDTQPGARAGDMKTPVLITDEEIYIKTESKTQVHDIEELIDRDDDAAPLIINRALMRDLADGLLAKLEDNLSAIALFVGSALFVLLGVWFVVGRLALIFALGICGMVAGALAKRPTNYAQAVRLAALSFTPLALADMGSLLLRGQSFSLPLLFVAGSLCVAVAVITTRDTPLAPAP